MPINKIDYSKTIIYKIQHKEKTELFYIGYTTNFDSRKYQHKIASDITKKSCTPSKFYIEVRKNGGWDEFEMIPLKQVDCKNRIGALIEEQKTIDEMKPTLNHASPYRKTKKA